jgi:hypothetical protein
MTRTIYITLLLACMLFGTIIGARAAGVDYICGPYSITLAYKAGVGTSCRLVDGENVCVTERYPAQGIMANDDRNGRQWKLKAVPRKFRGNVCRKINS